MPDENARQRRGRNAIIWTILGMAALIGIVTLISALGEDPAGDPLIASLDVLIGTLMTSFAGILMVLLPIALRFEAKSNRIKADTASIKQEVKNSHPDNLRDDMDDKHAEVVLMIQRTNKAIGHAIELTMGTKKDIRGIRRDVGRVQDHLEDTDRKLRSIDEAHDAAQKERLRRGKLDNR